MKAYKCSHCGNIITKISDSGVPVIDGKSGRMAMERRKRKVVERYDFARFKELWLKVKCDVGETTYFSEIAQTQTLDNLRREGVLDLIQYLERLPEKHIPRKQELIQELKARGEAAR